VFGANVQNVHSVVADQLVRQGLVVALSVLRRKTDLISYPRATSCKLAGSSLSIAHYRITSKLGEGGHDTFLSLIEALVSPHHFPMAPDFVGETIPHQRVS
jgi:hypothetical protein